ncbi:MAG: tRNA lysidine(34) synthetase TilS [Lachnospiraceae bacterium]|jgi:tRNA(Ile)-lysidine synthase|nr:tRNA lysidine(34) synthetase TilS [Lachnospiraceae bacterium]
MCKSAEEGKKRIQEMAMQKKVRNFMKEYHMVEEGDCVLVAVSGGADSICLLLLLLELCHELRITVCVVHVEHGIRGLESVKDAEFVEAFCRQRRIPYKIYSCNALEYARKKRISVEEGARELRYHYFQQATEEFGAHKTAVAHNQNDCAETMLFHLARGTGMKGLCGIKPVRERIIRPLLCVGRQEIEAFLALRKQEYCIDQTNQELRYTRNKIRHQVLPILEEINRGAVFHMTQTAAAVTEVVELLGELADLAVRNYVIDEGEGVCILEGLAKEKPVIQKAACHQILARLAGSNKNISRIHVEQICQLFAKQSGREIELPYGMKAQRIYSGIRLAKNKTYDMEAKWQNCWEVPEEGSFHIPYAGYEIHTRMFDKIATNQEIPKKMYTKWMDYDKIKGTMQMRTRQQQDFLVIDSQGNRKKLKKYFVDEKVPAVQRDKILLLADETHILWVVGYRISEDVKVTKHTKRILEIRVNGGTAHE